MEMYYNDLSVQKILYKEEMLIFTELLMNFEVKATIVLSYILEIIISFKNYKIFQSMV